MMNELPFQLIDEAKNIKTSTDFHKVLGSIVLLDQLLMIKTAFLAIAFRGGRSDVAKQVKNEMSQPNFKLIADFLEAGRRRGYSLNDYKEMLYKCNSIRRNWEHTAYVDFIKIRNNNDFLSLVSKIKPRLIDDIEMLLDINTQFSLDFADYFKENKWFKQCLA